jgi:hypothetical protein
MVVVWACARRVRLRQRVGGTGRRLFFEILQKRWGARESPHATVGGTPTGSDRDGRRPAFQLHGSGKGPTQASVTVSNGRDTPPKRVQSHPGGQTGKFCRSKATDGIAAKKRKAHNDRTFCPTIRQNHTLPKRIGRGMRGRGITSKCCLLPIPHSSASYSSANPSLAFPLAHVFAARNRLVGV